MTRQSPAVMPADFAQVAINMSQPQAAAHYGLSVWQVIRMMRQMTPEWRDEYRKGWRVRSSESATRNLNRYRAQFAANKAPGDKRKGPGPQTRPMPEGFYEFILHNSQDAACKEYRTSEKTVQRWKRLLDPEQRKAVTAGIQKRRAKPKSDKTPAKKPRGRGFGFNKLPDVAPLTGSTVAMAAQHLRIVERHVRPICSATVVLGKAGDGFYKYGTKLVPEAFILERAKAMGWAS